MTINWKKYVDQIYIITFAGKNNYEEYKKQLYDELNRVDILSSGILYEFENISTPFYHILYDSFFEKNKNLSYSSTDHYCSTFDAIMGHYYCMKHAQMHNYKRILVLEDDNIFLRNKEDIIKILDKQQENYDDRGYLFLGAAIHVCNIHENVVRDTLFQCTKDIRYDIYKITKKCSYSGGSFNIYDDIAYNWFIDYIESGKFNSNDIYDAIYDYDKINVYYSDTYICIQDMWHGFCLYSTYNYEFDINKRYVYLECMLNDSKKMNDYDLWATKIKFDELNSKMFDNKLTYDFFQNILKQYRQ